MKKGLLTGFLAMALATGIAFANPVFDDSVQSDESVAATTYQQLLKRSNQGNETYSKLFGNNDGSMMKVNMYCGFPPFPPMGCKVGACICDQNGQNCQWTFVCR